MDKVDEALHEALRLIELVLGRVRRGESLVTCQDDLLSVQAQLYRAVLWLREEKRHAL